MSKCISLFLIFGVLPAAAAVVKADAVSDCKSGNPIVVMKACTALIAEGDRSPIDLPLVHTYRANAANASGDSALALADLNKAIELAPGLPGAYVNRGNIFFSRGDHKGAILDYDRAIRLSPEFSGAYFNRGNLHSLRGDYAQALDDLSAAVRLDPAYAPAYFNRGLIYLRIDRPNDAARDFQKTLALNPKHLGATQALQKLGPTLDDR